MEAPKEWIFSGPRNGLFVVLEGKTVPMRITVHQHKAYLEFLEKTKKEREGKTGDVISAVRSMSVDPLAVAEIALNPIEGVLDYPKEKILEILDLDQVAILAAEWLDRKVFNPQANRPSDPLLPVVPVPVR